MKKTGGRIKIVFNSPVILTFTFVCLLGLGLNYITNGWVNYNLLSVYRSSLANPLTYVRFFGHVIGHAGWEHFIGNFMLILLVGPLLEEKYGSSNTLFVILSTALVTGLIQFIFFSQSMLCGASGVAFALILLSSFTCFKNREIPLTFILIAVIYIGKQIYEGLYMDDNISNLTHIIGGIIGAIIGFVLNKGKTIKN